jgi:hypothetical protein
MAGTLAVPDMRLERCGTARDPLPTYGNSICTRVSPGQMMWERNRPGLRVL